MKSPRLLITVFVAGAACSLLMGCDSSHPSQNASEHPVAPTPSSSVQAAVAAPIDNWSYTDDSDEMTGKKMFWACTSAPEGARLCLRKKNGQLESYISFNSVSDGQFLCLEDNCGTKARFDDGAVVRFGGVEAAGGTSTMLFVEPASKLVSMLRKSKTLKLQPPIYENSGEILHFDVSGLKW